METRRRTMDSGKNSSCSDLSPPPLPLDCVRVQWERSTEQEIGAYGATLRCLECKAIRDGEGPQEHSDVVIYVFNQHRPHSCESARFGEAIQGRMCLMTAITLAFFVDVLCSRNPHQEAVIQNCRLFASKTGKRQPPSIRTPTNQVGLCFRRWSLFTAVAKQWVFWGVVA